MKPSISVVIPAFNEEKNLKAAVLDLLAVIDRWFDSYEIIILNDGSTDQTGRIADHIASRNPNIQVVHQPRNMGLGFNVLSGFQKATKEYVMWYAGDNGMLQSSLEEMFKLVGKADIVIPYIANPEFRSKKRRMVSKLYTVILNYLTGLKLKYYNGIVIYRTELVKSINIPTNGFACLAEVLIRAIKSGATYVEVATRHRLRGYKTSKAFRIKNLIEITKALVWLCRSRPTPKMKTKPVLVSTKGQY